MNDKKMYVRKYLNSELEKEFNSKDIKVNIDILENKILPNKEYYPQDLIKVLGREDFRKIGGLTFFGLWLLENGWSWIDCGCGSIGKFKLEAIEDIAKL